MDPQQRLLLEVSWEALERAGIDPATLCAAAAPACSSASMYHDYGATAAPTARRSRATLLTGNTVECGVGAGGVCLRAGGARGDGGHGVLVVAGGAASGRAGAAHRASVDWRWPVGVTVMATPETFVEFSRQRGLAPDGRCKAFAEAADGTGWGEGVGLVVLERLSDARRQGP